MKRVEGRGPTPAAIMIVGEAPGEEEEQTGVPFVGPSGHLLDSLLLGAGIRRDECYITNVVKVRPPANLIPRLSEYGMKPEDFYDELYQEIQKVQPNIICAVGNTSLTALCDLESVTKWRGSILHTSSRVGYETKVLPVIHPAACLRTWSWTHILQFDLKRLAVQSGFKEIRSDPRVYNINPTFEQAVYWLYALKEKKRISFDLETYRGQPIIKMIGLAPDKTNAYCIPFVRNLTPIWTRDRERQLWTLVLDILLDPTKELIAQNQQFEMTQLAPFTGGKMKVWMDTLRAHAIAYPEYRHGLAFLTSIYTDMPYYKDDGKASDYDRNFDELQRYNCKDVLATFEVAEKLEEQLKRANLWEFYREFDCPLRHSLWRMQTYGIDIDKDKLLENQKRLDSEIEEIDKLIESVVGYRVNPKSHKQMTMYLYNPVKGIGLPAKFKRGTMNLTANEEALEELFAKTQRQEIQLLLELRRRRTLRETFLEMKLSPDGRIRTSYGVTKTGRLSSSEDEFGVGANLQNIPKRKGAWIRGMFCPRPGKLWVKCDLRQADARSVAWYARDPNLLRIFSDGGDIHRQTAALIFGLELDKVTPRQREIGKACVHALNYDMQPKKFSVVAGIILDLAKKYYAAYHRAFPNIQSVFQADIRSQLQKDRTLVNPFGRKRTFFDRWGDKLFRDAYAYLPQSITADVIDSAIPYIEEEFLDLPGEPRLLLQVHDELNFETRESELDQTVAIVKKWVERPVMIHGSPLIIPLDVMVGPNWYETKEYTR